MKRFFSSFQKDLIVSLSDIVIVIKKSRFKIALAFALFALYGFYKGMVSYAPKYKAAATFIDRGYNKNSRGSFNSQGLLQSKKSSLGHLVTSRKVLRPPIEEFGLQAHITPHNYRWRQIYNNFKQNCQIYKQMKQHPDKQLRYLTTSPFQIRNVSFLSEYPLTITLKFLSKDQASITYRDSREKLLTKNIRLGEEVVTDAFSFTLVANPTYPINLENKVFSITLNPFETAYSAIQESILLSPVIENSDLTFLKVEFSHRDAFLAADFTNHLLSSYQSFYQIEKEGKIHQQLQYLDRREKEAFEKVTDLLMDQKKFLTKNLENPSSFLLLENELQFITQQQGQYHNQLATLDLDLKLLDKMQAMPTSYLEIASENSAESRNQLIEGLIKNRQERDFLDLCIKQGEPKSSAINQALFQNYMQDLNSVQHTIRNIDTLLHLMENNALSMEELELQGASQDFLHYWIQELQLKHANAALEESISLKENFIAYLHNLQRIYRVKEKIIQERIAYEQAPSSLSMQGIDLDAATALLGEYRKKLDTIQFDIHLNQQLLQKLHNSDFQITSLLSGINDPISKSMLETCKELALKQHNSAYLAPKDADRITAQLQTEKQFLIDHIENIQDIHTQNAALVNDKIQDLQVLRLNLLQQKIAMQEEQLANYIAIKKDALVEKKQVILKQLADLHKATDSTPDKWLMEQKINLKTRLSQDILRSITELSEMNNIHNNLDVLGIQPIDMASAPLIPTKFNPLFQTAVYGFLGALIVTLWYLRVLVIHPIRATQHNLRFSGYQLLPTFSDIAFTLKLHALPQNEIEKFRAIADYFQFDHTSYKQAGQVMLMRVDPKSDFSFLLAEYLAKRNVKTLVIHLDRVNNTASHNLFDYLEKKEQEPDICSTSHCDIVYGGKQTAFSSEYLSSDIFKALLEKYKQHYTCVLIITHAKATTRLAQASIPLTNSLLIQLDSDETIQKLRPFRLIHSKQKLAFILAH